MCNCKITEIILSIVVILFAFVNAAYAKWIVVIAAVLLLIHAFTCRNLAACAAGQAPAMPAKKKK